MRKRALVALLAAFVLPGGAALAEMCTLDVVPAATLLLPYFEVEALVVAAGIDRDAVKPRSQAGLAAKAVERPVGSDEDLLHQILRVVTVAQEAETEVEDLVLMAFDDLPERLPVTVPRALDKIVFIHRSTAPGLP